MSTTHSKFVKIDNDRMKYFIFDYVNNNTIVCNKDQILKYIFELNLLYAVYRKDFHIKKVFNYKLYTLTDKEVKELLGKK